MDPRKFLKEGRKRDKNENVLIEMHRYAKILHKNDYPIIFSLNHLAIETGASYKFLRAVINGNIVPYKNYKIKKKNGKYRTITVPSPQLLKVQRWINKFILANVNLDNCVTAYRKGASPLKNAQKHLGANFLIKTDIKDFFTSITEKSIYKVFRNLGYTSLLSFELARLTTASTSKKTCKSLKYRIYSDFSSERHLAQGLPTSPMLANIVCKDLDKELLQMAKQEGLSYSRYSDDIIFSSYEEEVSRHKGSAIIKDVRKILSSYGFEQNLNKTSFIPKGAKKIVTGIVVNEEGLFLPKQYREQIEGCLKFAKRYGIDSFCRHHNISQINFYQKLKGMISYAKSIEKDRGAKYKRLFNKLDFDEALLLLP